MDFVAEDADVSVGDVQEITTREESYIEGYIKPPEPYIEELVPPEKRLWVSDFYDYLVPKRKSFLSDFVYHTRGIMTPTLACIWSVLFILQSVIKREAWLQWYPKPLYPNQYIIIIGGAGRIKKTTAVSIVGLEILKSFRKYIRDMNIYEMKNITIIKDKSTPEAMLTAMLPEQKNNRSIYFLRDADGNYLLDSEGKAVQYYPTSEASIIVSELATMISKRSYTDGMVEILLDLYDPHDIWEWRREGAGTKRLRKLCTSMIAGTTVDGFRGSIPNAAKGDGFLSRSVLVYVPESKRLYPQPFLPFGAPDTEEMAKRLAWIAENALGEFVLSMGAERVYTNWFFRYAKTMDNNPTLAGAISRMDINVLKTALLIRAARYERGTIVEEHDMEDAIKIVEATYNSVPFLLGQLDEDIILTHVARAEVFMRQRKRIPRWAFLTSMRMRSDIANIVVTEMIARGEVIVEYNGQEYTTVLGKTEEEYVWRGIEQEEKTNVSLISAGNTECDDHITELWVTERSRSKGGRPSRNASTVLQEKRNKASRKA